MSSLYSFMCLYGALTSRITARSGEAAGQSRARAAADASAARCEMSVQEASSAVGSTAWTEAIGADACDDGDGDGEELMEGPCDAVLGPEVEMLFVDVDLLLELRLQTRGERCGSEPPPASGGCEGSYCTPCSFLSFLMAFVRFLRASLTFLLHALALAACSSERSSASFGMSHCCKL